MEIDEKICQNVTAERLKKVIKGYKYGNTEIEGLGNGFQYCKLGSPCFDEKGRINPEIKFIDLARHVFFAEAGIANPKKPKADTPLIGTHQDIGIYLLYNGILKDKAPDGGNVLTRAVLEGLPKHQGPKIIYGTACRLGKTFLKQRNILFKQIPYEILVN